jgi:modulator of FtsH protease
MYQQSGSPGSPSSGGFAPAISAPGLLGQVLGITGVGFLFTAVAAYLFRGIPAIIGLIALIGGIVLIFVMGRVRNNPHAALLWFYAFTFLEGIGIAPVITQYAVDMGPQVVVNAAATTGLGMVLLGCVAYVFSVDWRRFSGIASIALILLIVVGIIAAFTSFIQPDAFSWLVLGVFGLWTLIDFSRIRAGGGGATAVEMAVAIYLDALNIFLAVLELMGSRGRR